MIRLPDSLRAWNSQAFATTLKRELEALGAAALPLQQGLAIGSVALDDGVAVMFLGADDEGVRILARVGVFFAGIVAGCSCADDPTPTEPQNEYCEMTVAIDKATGATTIRVADGGAAVR